MRKIPLRQNPQLNFLKRAAHETSNLNCSCRFDSEEVRIRRPYDLSYCANHSLDVAIVWQWERYSNSFAVDHGFSQYLFGLLLFATDLVRQSLWTPVQGCASCIHADSEFESAE